MSDTTTVPTYLTTYEVAEIFNVHVHTVLRMCKTGELDHIKVAAGRQYRIPVTAVEEFVAAHSPAADARAMLDASIGEGRIPAEAPPEVLGRIAEILRQHYAEKAAAG